MAVVASPFDRKRNTLGLARGGARLRRVSMSRLKIEVRKLEDRWWVAHLAPMASMCT